MDKLTASILSILNSKETIERWGMRSINIVHSYTIEKMVEKHLIALEGVKENNE